MLSSAIKQRIRRTITIITNNKKEQILAANVPLIGKNAIGDGQEPQQPSQQTQTLPEAQRTQGIESITQIIPTAEVF